MSYQVLARKWRPRLFSEVIAQGHITKTLKNAIESQRVAQAYLLTGTRGVGKTTIARIFAKALRCKNLVDSEPCLKCESCQSITNGSSIDYIEIDGASNNSVEDVRSLIENVQYLPTTGDYKVYVIDEVHMLSTNAFNALLKTLEEPPAHVVFIFATTDPQKLIGTVLSRCQRLDFKPASQIELENHLNEIAQKEGISFENPNIARKIAKRGDGSVRDALSLFDQVISFSGGNEISNEEFNLATGIIAEDIKNEILENIFMKNKSRLVEVFQKLSSQNFNLEFLTNEIIESLFDLIVVESNGSLPTELNSVSELSMPELMWIYENLNRDFKWALESLNPYNAVLFSLIKMSQRELIVGASKEKLVKKKVTSPIPQIKTWPDFHSYLFNKNKSLAVNLERGNLIKEIKDLTEKDIIEVGFEEKNKIFYDFLNESTNIRELNQSLEEFLGRACTLDLQIIMSKEVEDNNFKSTVEENEEKETERLEKQKETFLSNPFLMQAEEIFNSKIDKVVLEKRK